MRRFIQADGAAARNPVTDGAAARNPVTAATVSKPRNTFCPSSGYVTWCGTDFEAAAQVNNVTGYPSVLLDVMYRSLKKADPQHATIRHLLSENELRCGQVSHSSTDVTLPSRLPWRFQQSICSLPHSKWRGAGEVLLCVFKWNLISIMTIIHGSWVRAVTVYWLSDRRSLPRAEKCSGTHVDSFLSVWSCGYNCLACTLQFNRIHPVVLYQYIIIKFRQ